MSNEPEPIHEPGPTHEPEFEAAHEPEPESSPGFQAPVEAAPALPTPPPPPPPAGPAARFISNALLMVLGAILAAGGYALARAYAPPRPPTEITSGADAAVKPGDVKALAERDENIESHIDGLAKRIDMLPSPAAELKTLHDDDETNSQKLASLAGRLDAIDEKLAQSSRGDASTLKPVVDDMAKRIDDLGRQIAALRDQGGAPRQPAAAAAAAPEDVNIEGRAMEQAAGLFKEKKYAEARDAFVKLQGVYPDDARVWYYSALANGFATNQWTGETEKMVNTGMEKERAGSPPSARVDAVFADLTTATGKDWLAAYRKRISGR